MSELYSRLSYFISLMLGLSLNDWAMLVGILTAAGTFIVNWYYKRQHLKLAQHSKFALGDECE